MRTNINSVMGTGRMPNKNNVILSPAQNNWQQENSEIIETNQVIPNNFMENQNISSVVYNVKPGDTLWGIAQTYLGTGKKYYDIQNLNHLKDDNIHPGQTILIPQNLSSGWLLYNVESGDTLWNIARTYLGSWTKYNMIMSLNNLQNETIYPGQILKIPLKNQNNIYTVQPGDNLWNISLKLLGDGNRFYEIINLNNLQSDQVTEGQTLKIPEK
ncbi:MAG: LysM peptidoglycan-binding domain-containing protein [Clostridia bacterium]|nr:LysM peptidoglycan-binding domain-containing protein [Clostridia bacterium]